MVRRDVFEQVGGYNEEFAVGFNDADFCLRAWEAGYRTIFTPYAELYHYEFTSRGREEANEEKLRRWKREQALFMQRWPEFFLTVTRDSGQTYPPTVSISRFSAEWRQSPATWMLRRRWGDQSGCKRWLGCCAA